MILWDVPVRAGRFLTAGHHSLSSPPVPLTVTLPDYPLLPVQETVSLQVRVQGPHDPHQLPWEQEEVDPPPYRLPSVHLKLEATCVAPQHRGD